MLVDIRDVITCATFGDDRLCGLGVTSLISPISLRRRPYNSRTNVRVCDDVTLSARLNIMNLERLKPGMSICDSPPVPVIDLL